MLIPQTGLMVGTGYDLCLAYITGEIGHL